MGDLDRLVLCRTGLAERGPPPELDVLLDARVGLWECADEPSSETLLGARLKTATPVRRAAEWACWSAFKLSLLFCTL